MRKPKLDYVPALGFRFLTPLYDRILELTMGDPAFKIRLLEQACLVNGDCVLDVGCGTGTLSGLVCELVGSRGFVCAIDLDRTIISSARGKCASQNRRVNFTVGSATDIPFPENRFNHVVSSLMFHHLNRERKLSALREILRVLKPGGQLHVVDWGKPANKSMRLRFCLVQLLDGFETTRDNVNGALQELILQAGLEPVRISNCQDTIFGTLQSFHSRKPLTRTQTESGLSIP